MDTGHYNCRDYHISPHFAATALHGRHSLPRHESFDELEQRSRSPASQKPKFPLLSLPLELRQQILRYLLPRTQDSANDNTLASHARNFSAVQKRAQRGLRLPNQPTGPAAAGTSNVVWQRGNVSVLSVCRQLHDECAELVYGDNTFLLFVTFSGISFRFRWVLSSGLAPSRSYDFLELMPQRYLRLVKRCVLHVDHVDSYTGMIKFNVGGKGLTHGLRKQVQRLVDALKLPAFEGDENGTGGRRLAKLNIRVSNGNAVLDSIKSQIVRDREGSVRVSEDLEEMLEPFAELRGVREVGITGAVTNTFARKLERTMMSQKTADLADWDVIQQSEVFGIVGSGTRVDIHV